MRLSSVESEDAGGRWRIGLVIEDRKRYDINVVESPGNVVSLAGSVKGPFEICVMHLT